MKQPKERFKARYLPGYRDESDAKSYHHISGAKLEREYGRTPNGNLVGGRWVLRNPSGQWVDFDTYRNDLAERHNIDLN